MMLDGWSKPLIVPRPKVSPQSPLTESSSTIPSQPRSGVFWLVVGRSESSSSTTPYSGRRQFSKPFAKPVLSSTRTLENLHHLRARVPTRTQDNRGNRHVKLIRDRLHHSFVGGTTHRGRCNPDLEQISVPTRFRARRAGVHSNGDDHACLPYRARPSLVSEGSAPEGVVDNYPVSIARTRLASDSQSRVHDRAHRGRRPPTDETAEESQL